MRTRIPLLVAAFVLVYAGANAGFAQEQPPVWPDPLPTADGYRGIWYANQPQPDEYAYKYSGGLGTYCAKHRPMAVHCPEVKRTFFCYGGTDPNRTTLLHMVSYYDHATGTVPRPRILLDKQTTDAHDNPVITVDARGHIWIFSAAHGTARPAYISVSKKPYSIDAFECVAATNYSYPQPHVVPGEGFLFLHTRYLSNRRRLFAMTSADGRTWSEPRLLAQIERGHYQISERHGSRVGTAMNFHPNAGGLNARTNLYYLETDDFGRTWRTAAGEPIELPLVSPDNPALVHDFRAEGLLVYLKDIVFDADGRPVILILTSRGWESGPKNDPRVWRTARWDGNRWDIRGTVTSDNNYDMGSLWIEDDGSWRLIAPTEPGPQPYNPGGEVVVWLSRDRGASWEKVRQLTRGSQYNHTYVRRVVNAHPEFYAFWADGHARKPSESRLYFADRSGERVWRLPERMGAAKSARPEPIDAAR